MKFFNFMKLAKKALVFVLQVVVAILSAAEAYHAA